MAIFPCPIPKITEPKEHTWTQAKHSEIKFTSDGYAVVTLTGLEHLQLLTQPPIGVYPGRMWKQQEGDSLYLYWYQQNPGDTVGCEIKFRKILPQEAFDLLNPGGKDNL